MIKVLNRDELLEIANNEEKISDEQTRNFLKVVANGLGVEKNIQVRLNETSTKKELKIYKYDRFLYRFILDSKIAIS